MVIFIILYVTSLTGAGGHGPNSNGANIGGGGVGVGGINNLDDNSDSQISIPRWKNPIHPWDVLPRPPKGRM